MVCLYIHVLLLLTNAVYHSSLVISPDAVNKYDSCPKPTGSGICVELCSSDMDCSGNQKCCSNGCGHVCENPVDVDLCSEKGESITFCFIDPCDVITCPEFPEAQCVPNYCHGCYASFFVGDKNVTNMCEGDDDICPDGSSPVDCFVDPCQVAKCSKYPNARCAYTNCEGCNANFFIGNQDVTKHC